MQKSAYRPYTPDSDLGQLETLMWTQIANLENVAGAAGKQELKNKFWDLHTQWVKALEGYIDELATVHEIEELYVRIDDDEFWSAVRHGNRHADDNFSKYVRKVSNFYYPAYEKYLDEFFEPLHIRTRCFNYAGNVFRSTTEFYTDKTQMKIAMLNALADISDYFSRYLK